jgi:hypothetical protein
VPAAPVPAAPPADPCALLTSAEIAAVQGEAVQDSRAHRQAGGGLLRLACFYTLPTFSRSLSLEVTVADPAAGDPRAARAFWEQRLARQPGSAEEAEERGGAEEEEEEESRPPVPVPGVGEQAFWVGTPLGGTLYVLQRDLFFRLSVGGGVEPTVQIERLSGLARRVLERLSAAPAPAERPPAR